VLANGGGCRTLPSGAHRTSCLVYHSSPSLDLYSLPRHSTLHMSVDSKDQLHILAFSPRLTQFLQSLGSESASFLFHSFLILSCYRCCYVPRGATIYAFVFRHQHWRFLSRCMAAVCYLASTALTCTNRLCPHGFDTLEDVRLTIW
jgi:hypothetical protein